MQKRQVDTRFDIMGKLATLEPALSKAEIDAETATASADRARCR